MFLHKQRTFYNFGDGQSGVGACVGFGGRGKAYHVLVFHTSLWLCWGVKFELCAVLVAFVCMHGCEKQQGHWNEVGEFHVVVVLLTSVDLMLKYVHASRFITSTD